MSLQINLLINDVYGSFFEPKDSGNAGAKGDSSELYELANKFFETVSPPTAVSMFKFVRHITEISQL